MLNFMMMVEVFFNVDMVYLVEFVLRMVVVRARSVEWALPLVPQLLRRSAKLLWGSVTRMEIRLLTWLKIYLKRKPISLIKTKIMIKMKILFIREAALPIKLEKVEQEPRRICIKCMVIKHIIDSDKNKYTCKDCNASKIKCEHCSSNVSFSGLRVHIKKSKPNGGFT